MHFVVIIVVVLLWLLGKLITFTVTVAFWATPLVAALAYIVSRSAGHPPVLDDPAKFDDARVTNDVAELVGRRAEAAAAIVRARVEAESAGVSLTKNSGMTRYDTRSSAGKRANKALDVLEPRISELDEAIRDARAGVYRALPPWRAEFDGWARLSAVRTTFDRFYVRYVVVLVVCLLTTIMFKGMAEFVEGLLIWRPIERLAKAPVILGVLVVYPVWLLTYRGELAKQYLLIDQDRAGRWQELVRKWSPETDPETYFGTGGGARGGAQERAGQDVEPLATWYEVLGVSADASLAEIRAAYRDLIKQYHSDRVTGLGEKIQQVAKEQAQLINRAYEEAKRARSAG